MYRFLSVSPETLKAAHSGIERERDMKLKNASGTSLFTPARCPCCHPSDTSGLKNAVSDSTMKGKPAWLTTFENSIGNNYPIPSNNTTAAEEELKQASSSNNNTTSNSIPNWLISFHNRRREQVTTTRTGMNYLVPTKSKT